MHNQTQHKVKLLKRNDNECWWDAPGLALLVIGVSVLDWCLLQVFLKFWLVAIKHTCISMRLEQNVQCIGCKVQYDA
jgi:hypothetical protein